MPLAPALLSTTTACLVSAVIDAPSARASWSVALPAANGTTKVIGWSGYLPWAKAPVAAKDASSAATTARRPARKWVMRVSMGLGERNRVVGAGQVRAQRVGDGDRQVEQQEGERLAVAVEVERVVDAAVEDVVEDEVHRLQVRQQVARDAARAAVRELRRDARFADLLDQHRPERRMPGDRR